MALGISRKNPHEHDVKFRAIVEFSGRFALKAHIVRAVQIFLNFAFPN